MPIFRVLVTYADGDDFSKTQISEIEVFAENEMTAKLLANQLAYTPHVGKPDHLQIVKTEVVNDGC